MNWSFLIASKQFQLSHFDINDEIKLDYTEKWEKMLTPEIVRYLTTIHEYKGEQRLIVERHADVLESLVEVGLKKCPSQFKPVTGIAI